MTIHSETSLLKIQQLAEERGESLFEAAAVFCEKFDLEPTEFIHSLDSHAIDMIKSSAIKGNFVRKCVQQPSGRLPL